MTHTLTTSMTLPVPRADVFAFFAEAHNLERITPPALRFHITSPSPVTIEQDALIEYTMRLHGVHFGWLTKITRWDPPHEFVDEQLKGPYKLWVHRHTFEERDGTTIINDEVRYRLPLWPFGEIVHPIIRRQLNSIFAYRQQAVARYFAEEYAH
jgi:ligand-binding SRPBCC domain-containing protein